MSEVRPTYDDEIDLFEVFGTLWDGKWKIVATTFIAAIVSISSSVSKPNSFDVSTTIKPSQRSVFVEYTSLNDILKTNELALSIDSKTVFQMLVFEFNDYEEMISVLEKDAFVQQSVDGLTESAKRQKSVGLAKSFVIQANSDPHRLKSETDLVASFKWHDAEEGKVLFNEALSFTLANVKKTIVDEITQLAYSIDSKNSREFEKLKVKLGLIAGREKEKIEKRIQKLKVKLGLIAEREKERIEKRVHYLREQSAIAKEMGIETNRFDTNSFSTQSLDLAISNVEVPFSYRGYKAIDKEISLILSRSKKQQLLMASDYLKTKDELAEVENDLSSKQFLMASDYLETKDKLAEVENDLSSKQLRQTLRVLENDKPNDWVEYDLSLAESKSQKKSRLHLASSLLLGGMIGVMYVLISNAVRKRKEKLAEA
jgi:LPS O-antigen subunit length determinant protein (WzzB/FepE family)